MGALVSFLLFLNNFIQVSNECWSFSAPYYSPSPTPLLKFPSPINHFGVFCFLENFWKLYFEQTSNKRKYALIDFVFAHL